MLAWRIPVVYLKPKSQPINCPSTIVDEALDIVTYGQLPGIDFRHPKAVCCNLAQANHLAARESRRCVPEIDGTWHNRHRSALRGEVQ